MILFEASIPLTEALLPLVIPLIPVMSAGNSGCAANAATRICERAALTPFVVPTAVTHRWEISVLPPSVGPTQVAPCRGRALCSRCRWTVTERVRRARARPRGVGSWRPRLRHTACRWTQHVEAVVGDLQAGFGCLKGVLLELVAEGRAVCLHRHRHWRRRPAPM